LPDRAEAIDVDRFGNVYVSGTAFHTSSGVDASITTIKYDAGGKEQWVVRGPASFYVDPVGLSVDGFGNVYVAGTTWSSSTWRDYVTVKYSPAGIQLWARTYNGPANSADIVIASAIDKSGNVYVTGNSWGTDTYYDAVTIKYDAGGLEQWVARYDGPPGSSDWVRDLVVDGSGNVYVAVSPFAVIKYDSKGSQVWVKDQRTRSDAYPGVAGIAVDALGDIYVTGSIDSYPNPDQVVAKYDPDGKEQWTLRHEVLSAVGIAVDSWGNVYTAGSTSGSGWSIFSLMKCIQSPPQLAYPSGYWLAQNYPNPFNSATTFRYSIPVPSNVSLKLFNILGQEVTAIVSSEHIAGIHEITWSPGNLASGVYFYRLQAGGFLEMKKMVLLK
jgi:hypothetical protein